MKKFRKIQALQFRNRVLYPVSNIIDISNLQYEVIILKKKKKNDCKALLQDTLGALSIFMNQTLVIRAMHGNQLLYSTIAIVLQIQKLGQSLVYLRSHL